MTTDSNGNKALHPFFTKMQPKTTYKRSMPTKSHSNPPVKSTAMVKSKLPSSEKENKKPAEEPCPAESSTSAAKRYAKYRETLREQRRQEQRETILDTNPLSLEEQLYLDFYGCPEDEPTPQQQQQKREPMWPDRNVFRGGHVRQLEDEEMFSPIETPPLRQNTSPHVRDIIAKHGTSFFQSMASRQKQSEPPTETTTKKKQPKGKQKPDLSRDEIEHIMDQVYRESQWKEIPACQALFNTLLDEQVPSDLPWTEKYRPRTVDGLLGDQRSFNYMLDWLGRLKVSSREDEGRRKMAKRDSSPDLSMDELTLEDDDRIPSDDSDDSDFEMVSKRPRKRTRKEQSNVKSNMMLIFGGCGVGKTASVYTIAQQLGYEVFEINAGMRRAGKDVMAAVGEMTESHHVNFAESADILSIFRKPKKRQQPSNDSSATKKKRRTDAAKKSSGSIMNHFARISIKPKEDESDTDDMDLDVEEDEEEEVVEEKAPNAKQFLGPTKQSLILLEEVDLLYEDDKGFWAAVQELAQKSKRPIIMTCNDTDMVPTEALKLEKAIYIAPQTTNNLMPYLQLLCFKEGYVVDPSDLLYLVAVMGGDLRQLIHTLEVWCKQLPTDDLSKTGRFRTCTGLFSQYMATDSDDLVLRLATDIQPEDIDVLELCQLMNNNKRVEPRRRAITAKEFFGSDLLATYRALETAAFSDTWITRQANQCQVKLLELCCV
ncbi:P-loop containing nucleoside triphosphate hydrolase protein [Fennellomyces sp. T-0311]|nr:P-loop containing nucleoside triphosphate hydrolase protein [Fennellomyces sp. T-0311]